MESDMTTPTEALSKLGLTIKAQFVPFSQSRHKDETYKTLNWRVTVLRNDKPFLTTDYSAGSGHCPADKSKEFARDSWLKTKAIEAECETGKPSMKMGDNVHTAHGKPFITLKAEDVFYSLSSDADILNYPSYGEFAREFGYDEDSRKGEAVYRACLDIGLKMRAALGEAGLQELREAFQDY
jgi:hypothetical protein